MKQLTINLTEQPYEVVAEMALAKGITMTESIRRSVALYKFFEDHPDSEFLIKTGDDVKQIVWPISA